MRILNVTVDEKKKIVLALTDIFGIGLKRAKQILKTLNIEETINIENLSEEKKEELKSFLVDKEKTLASYLKRAININFKNNIMLNTYKGTRYKHKMPVRGQRTRSNNKTNKKKPISYVEI